MNRGASGCGLLIVLAVAVMAVLWVVGVALWILAAVIPIAGLIFGGVLFHEAFQQRGAQAIREAVDAELAALTRDASLDLAETIARFDTVLITKGIGTDLQGHDDLATEIHAQLLAAYEALQAAATPAHRIEAVLKADQVSTSAARYL